MTLESQPSTRPRLLTIGDLTLYDKEPVSRCMVCGKKLFLNNGIILERCIVETERCISASKARF